MCKAGLNEGQRRTTALSVMLKITERKIRKNPD